MVQTNTKFDVSTYFPKARHRLRCADAASLVCYDVVEYYYIFFLNFQANLRNVLTLLICHGAIVKLAKELRENKRK